MLRRGQEGEKMQYKQRYSNIKQLQMSMQYSFANLYYIWYVFFSQEIFKSVM